MASQKWGKGDAMDIAEIERYIAGSDELNRKRHVVKRVMRHVIICLSFAINWKSLEPATPSEVLSIDLPIGQITFEAEATFTFNEKPIGLQRHKEVRNTKLYVILKEKGIRHHLEDREGIEGLSSKLIPELYQCLPEIVERTSAVPGSGIKREFDFFIAQAPS